ncbi:MAG: rhomboid family intramembrane serine protease [Acidobacteriota bacterium]
MLIPISDDDRRLTGTAYITILLLLANIAVFAYQITHPEFTYGWSVVPYEITTGEDLTGPVELSVGRQSVQIPQTGGPVIIYLTILSAMFMHGGLLHLGGNMLYLWIFGDNVEHRFGSFVFLIFYLWSGLAATFTQIALDPDSMIPNLGASGAISGVMGAYMVLFPRNRVHAIVFYYVISIPAFLSIGLWIAFQLIAGAGVVGAAEHTGGVAHGAHIGGFFSGVILALILRTMIKQERDNAISRAERLDSRRIW